MLKNNSLHSGITKKAEADKNCQQRTNVIANTQVRCVALGAKPIDVTCSFCMRGHWVVS
jgi:hypothetical protein